MNWISIKDKLPEDGQTVIVWNRRLNRFGVDTFNLCMPKTEAYYFWAKHGIDNVTHWMIPTPPDDLEITAAKAITNLANSQQDIPPDIAKVVNEHFWDLL